MVVAAGRGMVKTALGTIGYIASNTSPGLSTPLLCFHSSPRSFDEYSEVILLFPDRNVVAIDAPGYGISENPIKSCSLDDIADAFLEVADSLNIEKFVVVGSLMGNFIGVSLASRYPDRVVGCICANLFYFPPKSESSPSKGEEGKPIPDSWELTDDGSHLVDIHNRRKWLDADLNVRVVQSELSYLINRRARYAHGISIEDLNEYNFEAAATQVMCPTLCIKGVSAFEFFDNIGYHGTQQFEVGTKLFRTVEVESLDGPKSTINMINQIPEPFVAICTNFLEQKGL